MLNIFNIYLSNIISLEIKVDSIIVLFITPLIKYMSVCSSLSAQIRGEVQREKAPFIFQIILTS